MIFQYIVPSYCDAKQEEEMFRACSKSSYNVRFIASSLLTKLNIRENWWKWWKEKKEENIPERNPKNDSLKKNLSYFYPISLICHLPVFFIVFSFLSIFLFSYPRILLFFSSFTFLKVFFSFYYFTTIFYFRIFFFIFRWRGGGSEVMIRQPWLFWFLIFLTCACFVLVN